MATDFVAGCLGGCAGIMVGYPFDTIKVHIQTQDHRNPKYKGTWHCFRTLIARDSVAGLYRGMTSPMAGVAAVNAIVFGVYGQAQKFLSDDATAARPGSAEHQQQQQQQHLGGYFLAGASAGLAQAPVCSPIELAKTRLQLQGSNGPTAGSSPSAYTGPFQCLRQIHRLEGVRGVFSGLGVTLMREAPSYGVYFLTYETLTRSAESQPIGTLRMLLAGGLAGTASWVVTYPLDVVKSRLQADSAARYSGALDCFRKSVSAEGYACLFRGLGSTILRAFPTNAATFAVVTWTLRLLGEEDQQQQQQRRIAEPVPMVMVVGEGAAASAGSGELMEELEKEQQQQQHRRHRHQKQDDFINNNNHSNNNSNNFQSPKGLESAGAIGYLRKLGQESLALYAMANEGAGGGLRMMSSGVNRYHFDESHYFDWTREVLHY